MSDLFVTCNIMYCRNLNSSVYSKKVGKIGRIVNKELLTLKFKLQILCVYKLTSIEYVLECNPKDALGQCRSLAPDYEGGKHAMLAPSVKLAGLKQGCMSPVGKSRSNLGWHGDVGGAGRRHSRAGGGWVEERPMYGWVGSESQGQDLALVWILSFARQFRAVPGSSDQHHILG